MERGTAGWGDTGLDSRERIGCNFEEAENAEEKLDNTVHLVPQPCDILYLDALKLNLLKKTNVMVVRRGCWWSKGVCAPQARKIKPRDIKNQEYKGAKKKTLRALLEEAI